MNRLQLVEVNLVPQVGVNLDWRTAEIPTRCVRACCFNSRLVTLDGTDKSQNLKNSRRANATIIKLMVDSCTHKFSFFTFVGRVTLDRLQRH
jgi:hypothetical protein